MANELGTGVKYSFQTATDLSSKQYCFVKMSAANTVAICAATTDKPIGVLQNKPVSGAVAEVLVAGITKVKTAAATVFASHIGTDGSGLAAIYVQGSGTTNYIVGQMLDTTAAANGYGTATINCLNSTRGA